MNLLRNYSLSIVLLALFIGSWIIQTVTGWIEFRAQQAAHHEAAQLFGANGYIYPWAKATFENWQSEFLQLLTFVVLTSFLIHKGSHESKDSDERLKQAVDRIERSLRAIEMFSESGETQARRAAEPNGQLIHKV